MNKLEFQNVSFCYHTKSGETPAVENLSFSVEDNSLCAIVGPSGCGKTTLLSLASKLLTPSNGKIIFNFNGQTAYMTQRDNLFPWRKVKDNVLLPLEISKRKTEKNVAYANALLEKYGLSSFSEKYPKELSGGMRQRVALIRTLVVNPDILLLDEPTSALDYQTRLNVANDLFNIIKGEKKTALLVTHDISEAISLADKIIVLSSRPAHISANHHLPFNGETPLERRSSPLFSELFKEIWEEISK